MSYGDAFDKLMRQRNRSRVILMRESLSIATVVAAAMEMHAMTGKIIRDMDHPRYRDKVAPSSPKPRFRKGR